MNLIAVYFLFSVGTVLIVAVHILNLVLLKLKNRNLFGQHFTKGTPEYESMLKSIGRRYIGATILALLLSLLNLIFAVREVLQSFGRQRALTIVFIITLVALTIIIGIILTPRVKLAKDAERHSIVKDGEDDDW